MDLSYVEHININNKDLEKVIENIKKEYENNKKIGKELFKEYITSLSKATLFTIFTDNFGMLTYKTPEGSYHPLFTDFKKYEEFKKLTNLNDDKLIFFPVSLYCIIEPALKENKSCCLNPFTDHLIIEKNFMDDFIKETLIDSDVIDNRFVAFNLNDKDFLKSIVPKKQSVLNKQANISKEEMSDILFNSSNKELQKFLEMIDTNIKLSFELEDGYKHTITKIYNKENFEDELPDEIVELMGEAVSVMPCEININKKSDKVINSKNIIFDFSDKDIISILANTLFFTFVYYTDEIANYNKNGYIDLREIEKYKVIDRFENESIAINYTPMSDNKEIAIFTSLKDLLDYYDIVKEDIFENNIGIKIIDLSSFISYLLESDCHKAITIDRNYCFEKEALNVEKLKKDCKKSPIMDFIFPLASLNEFK